MKVAIVSIIVIVKVFLLASSSYATAIINNENFTHEDQKFVFSSEHKLYAAMQAELVNSSIIGIDNLQYYIKNSERNILEEGYPEIANGIVIENNGEIIVSSTSHSEIMTRRPSLLKEASNPELTDMLLLGSTGLIGLVGLMRRRSFHSHQPENKGIDIAWVYTVGAFFSRRKTQNSMLHVNSNAHSNTISIEEGFQLAGLTPAAANSLSMMSDLGKSSHNNMQSEAHRDSQVANPPSPIKNLSHPHFRPSLTSHQSRSSQISDAGTVVLYDRVQ